MPSATRAIPDWLLSLGLALTGLGGAFLPWLWREAVALQLTAPGLAEFIKFLPELRLGQLELHRLYFLGPLFLAMLALPLFAVNRRLDLPGWWRWSLRLLVIPLALAALSPVWTPAILLNREFRLQTLLAVLALGLTVIAPLLKNLPLKFLVLALIGGGMAALILPAWQFSLVQLAVSEVYRDSIRLGWGWWLTEIGLILSMGGGLWAAFRRR